MGKVVRQLWYVSFFHRGTLTKISTHWKSWNRARTIQRSSGIVGLGQEAENKYKIFSTSSPDTCEPQSKLRKQITIVRKGSDTPRTSKIQATETANEASSTSSVSTFDVAIWRISSDCHPMKGSNTDDWYWVSGHGMVLLIGTRRTTVRHKAEFCHDGQFLRYSLCVYQGLGPVQRAKEQRAAATLNTYLIECCVMEVATLGFSLFEIKQRLFLCRHTSLSKRRTCAKSF